MLLARNQICSAIAGVVVLLVLAYQAFGQATQNPKPADDADVLRIFSELVQTDVMVFDKQGKFVSGLKREDFELRIDGKPRPVDFFERINAGSTNEELQLAAARGSSSNAKGTALPLDRGRTIFFYVDDLHLAAGSASRTRKLLSRFLDQDMGQNDEVAVASASGQIGFLQQLSNNKAVLRAAIDRLSSRSFSTSDMDRPPMTEYEALQINRNDREVLNVFVDAMLRENPRLARGIAEEHVRLRVMQRLQLAASITTNTLAGLESLVRSSSKLPGRKVIFFISDGFFLDDRTSDPLERLRRIASAAARSGVVIYSLDARGLVASLVDASSEVAFDPSGRLQRSEVGEIAATQDGMNSLARDTGGRPFFDSNALDVGLSKALEETSVYYLLAWRPDQETRTSGKFRRLAVSLVGRPDLTVRVRHGFYDLEPPATANQSKDKAKSENADSRAKSPALALREAFKAIYPNTELPVAVTLGFLDSGGKDLMLTATMQVTTQSLSLTSEGGKQKAQVDIGVAVYNDHGREGASLNDRLTVTATSVEELRRSSKELIYNYRVHLPPGLYQVRVGARDAASGKVGTAFEWIVIPDLAAHQLALSSLWTGERLSQAPGATNTDPSGLAMASVRVDHRFHRNSFLRFVLYVYNATLSPADSKPDVAVQVQVLRDQQPVITTPSKRLSSENIQQLNRLPYGADVSLEGLAPGRYVLQISVVDRVSKSSASQQMRFAID